jgi:hypothetical protein
MHPAVCLQLFSLAVHVSVLRGCGVSRASALTKSVPHETSRYESILDKRIGDGWVNYLW